MHIPDGFVDLPVSVAAAAVSVPAVAVATRRAGRQILDRDVPIAGLIGAYLVVAQLLVFPLGLGTGAHLLGIGLALVLVGPWITMAVTAVVLVLQALVFADGGISALGLNMVNNGIVPVLVGWLVLTLVLGRRSNASGRVVGASALAAGLGTFAGATAFALELAVGGTGDATGVITTGFLAAYAVVAVIEGTLTGLLVAALRRSRPDLVLRWRHVRGPTNPTAPTDPITPGPVERRDADRAAS